MIFSIVLVIYCCITNYPKLKWAETIISIYYLSCSVGQTFGNSIAWWFWLRVSNAVQVYLWAGTHLKAWLGLEGQLLRRLTHTAIGRRPQSFFTGLLEPPHKMAAGSSQIQ